MTLDDILSRLKGVKHTATGALALCSAHQDRNPSLSIKTAEDGRILLHCWAGCKTDDVLAAIGLRFSDLFPAQATSQIRKAAAPLRACAWDREHTAFLLKTHSDCLAVRAEATLMAASGLDCQDWSDEEMTMTVAIVGRAYADLERADMLREVAFAMRRMVLERKKVRIAA